VTHVLRSPDDAPPSAQVVKRSHHKKVKASAPKPEGASKRVAGTNVPKELPPDTYDSKACAICMKPRAPLFVGDGAGGSTGIWISRYLGWWILVPAMCVSKVIEYGPRPTAQEELLLTRACGVIVTDESMLICTPFMTSCSCPFPDEQPRRRGRCRRSIWPGGGALVIKSMLICTPPCVNMILGPPMSSRGEGGGGAGAGGDGVRQVPRPGAQEVLHRLER
jgi:hypothetical protein